MFILAAIVLRILGGIVGLILFIVVAVRVVEYIWGPFRSETEIRLRALLARLDQNAFTSTLPFRLEYFDEHVREGRLDFAMAQIEELGIAAAEAGRGPGPEFWREMAALAREIDPENVNFYEQFAEDGLLVLPPPPFDFAKHARTMAENGKTADEVRTALKFEEIPKIQIVKELRANFGLSLNEAVEIERRCKRRDEVADA